jgi:hypothetical protein
MQQPRKYFSNWTSRNRPLVFDSLNALFTKTGAATAAAFTTITLFAAVASLADSDRTALMMAKSQPTQVAAR